MESVLREFDTVIFEKATPDNVLALVDGTSLLWRLELMGIDAGERRWERLTESCAKLIGSHGLAWLAELCVQQKNVPHFHTCQKMTLLVIPEMQSEFPGCRKLKEFTLHWQYLLAMALYLQINNHFKCVLHHDFIGGV